MKARSSIRWLVIITILFFICLPQTSPAATDQRLALVIGNGSYETGPLRNPVNDASDMANALKSLGFEVILKKNVRHQEMEEAVEDFGKRLRRGGVGLFYYAGHGVQVGGINYLLPIGARINKESDVKHQAVSAEKVLDEMAEANNGLNIVLLDACRDNPFGRSFRSASRGLAIISSAPEGTFISYATGPGQVSRDGEGRNSPYTAALLKYMTRPGLPIERVFKEVRVELSRQKQTPWELSSLKGEFYFAASSAAARESSEPAGADRPALNPIRETTEVAMGARPSLSTVNEIRRDGRFIAYDNGTVLDTRTNLMWAAMDNGSNINLNDAKNYCENYRGGGYTDWRIPTQDELAGLHDGSVKGNNEYHLTTLITLTACCPWVAGGSDAANFNFTFGIRNWHSQSWGEFFPRVLPVRNAK